MDRFSIDNLVLDAAPLLSTAASSSASALRGLASNFITTPDVLSEIRDKTSRELFASTLTVLGLEDDKSETGGLQVKEPTLEAVGKVTAFAKLTGDIAVLSQADIRVLALTYALEVEQNGTRRLREAPGKLSQEEQEREAARKERLAKAAAAQSEPGSQASKTLSTETITSGEAEQDRPNSRTLPEGRFAQGNRPESASEEKEEEAEELSATTSTSADSIDELAAEVEQQTLGEDIAASQGNTSDSDSEGGEWITPSNVTLHKSRDLGLFPSLPSSSHDVLGEVKSKKGKQKTVLKVACLTGDYAMQNVALQMGLNVFGVGGKKVKEVKTWVLRCHACFKICKDPTKKFCPSCGNPTLIRTSITYVTPTPENPKGFILHLKANYQYRLRGTQFSLPSPKPGSSNALKNSKNAELILREDQKEWQRGIKSAEIMKGKQERAAAKAMREGRGSAVFGGLSFDDPDWQPGMMLGEKGRSGGQPGVRTGKDGLPIIGYGRRNPNESRRKRK